MKTDHQHSAHLHAHEEYKDRPPFEYDQITEHIYLGTNACCFEMFNEELLEKGIAADISVEDERVDMPFGVKYFLWLPTKDHTSPTFGQLRSGAYQIRELVDNDEKLYIHCKNGHGRAPTLLAAYFVLMGDEVDEAVEKIKAKRQSIHPEPEQIEQLRAFEGFCRERKNQA